MYTSLDTRQTRDWRMQHACGSHVLATWSSSCSQVAHCESWWNQKGSCVDRKHSNARMNAFNAIVTSHPAVESLPAHPLSSIILSLRRVTLSRLV
jgi:hypothetical protein